jgi:hypothetical protein
MCVCERTALALCAPMWHCMHACMHASMHLIQSTASQRWLRSVFFLSLLCIILHTYAYIFLSTTLKSNTQKFSQLDCMLSTMFCLYFLFLNVHIIRVPGGFCFALRRVHFVCIAKSKVKSGQFYVESLMCLPAFHWLRCRCVSIVQSNFIVISSECTPLAAIFIHCSVEAAVVISRYKSTIYKQVNVRLQYLLAWL